MSEIQHSNELCNCPQCKSWYIPQMDFYLVEGYEESTFCSKECWYVNEAKVNNINIKHLNIER
jgi:hypothetical protein